MYHNFIGDCLNGTATLSDLENYVDYWHDNDHEGQSLMEFLGLTMAEYTLWLKQDSDVVFRDILEKRQCEQLLAEVKEG